MLAERYQLGASLGRGGMAEVHEAVAVGAHGFSRRVAIKRLLPELGGDDMLVRSFLDEARIASRLHHAGIVSILDYGVVDDRPFQVLELVDGKDAAFLERRARARGKAVPVDVALYVITQVAHALHHAHTATDEQGVSLGIVHRDVKPSNILVSRSGDVKLGDFGIALARERASKTTTFVQKGTPSFMAPEQLVGGVIDARTDVFALGLSLCALLEGKSPLAIEGARAALLGGSELPLPASLPDDVRRIVERAVRRKPEERYESAAHMARDLGAALATRLETDARTRMLAWLDELGGPDAPPPATTQPLRFTLDTAKDGTRRFTTEQAAAPPSKPAGHRPLIFLGALLATLFAAGILALGVVVGRTWSREPSARDASTNAADATVDRGIAVRDAAEALAAMDLPDAGAGASEASTSRPPPSAGRTRCFCTTRRSARHVTALYPKRMTPQCQCITAPPAHTLCARPRHEGSCAGFVQSGQPDAPCTGYDDDGSQRQGKLTKCDFCRGPVPPSAGVPGAPCKGYECSYGELWDGIWECE